MRSIIVLALLLALPACSAAQQAQVAPEIRKACLVYGTAESNPIVQTALALGTAAANTETAGLAGIGVAGLKLAGDEFCASPLTSPGAASPPAAQAAWLAGPGGISTQLLQAAAAVVPTKAR